MDEQKQLDSSVQQSEQYKHESVLSSQPNPGSGPRMSRVVLIGVLTVVVLGLGLLGGYLLFSPKSTSTVTDLHQDSMTIPSPTSDLSADWKTYTMPSLQIEFQLPPQIHKKTMETINNGQTGKQVCLDDSEQAFMFVKKAYAGASSCHGSILSIGTVSTDYSAGRSGMFTDYRGFVERNGKFYARFVSGKEDEIPTGLVRKITNKQGLDILIVQGINGEGGYPAIGTPGAGEVGALMNLPGKTYTGIAFVLTLNKGVYIDDFEKILSTVTLTGESGTDTTSWKTYSSKLYGFSFKYPRNVKLDEEKSNLPGTESEVNVFVDKNINDPVISSISIWGALPGFDCSSDDEMGPTKTQAELQRGKQRTFMIGSQEVSVSGVLGGGCGNLYKIPVKNKTGKELNILLSFDVEPSADQVNILKSLQGLTVIK